MKKSFKERAVIKAASLSKQHKWLKPFIISGLAVVLSFCAVFNYFANNSKRYITIVLCLVFFFTSSSFATFEQVEDSEIYLVDTGINSDVSGKDIQSVDVADGDIPLSEIIYPDDLFEIDEINDEIISVSLLSESESSDLESTENIDTFTLDDFLEKFGEDDFYVDEKTSGFDKDAWYLILVNKTHPIPEDYNITLADITSTMKCDERVLEPLLALLNAAKKEGHGLYVCSPYRDFALQTALFDKKINYYMGLGYSYIDAYRISSRKVIMPGASEHQLGLAFDIVVNYHATLDYEFGDTAAGLWLKNHCAEYGFILRYPYGKELITGIEYEPWHFRYVGVEAATYIMENDITLEEFIEGL